MKNLLCILAAVMLLCGCNQNDARIRKLEQRVDVLQQSQSNSLASVETALSKMLRIVSDDQSNWQAMLPLLEKQATPEIDPATGLPPQMATDLRVTALETQFSNLIATINGRRATTPTQNHATAGNGMPADVAAQIRTDAEKKWPAQYDMQVYEINKQVEAWNQLHR
jgi:hypothetical protein